MARRCGRSFYTTVEAILGCAKLKAVIPGGRRPRFHRREIDVPMDFDSVAMRGSLLVSAAYRVDDHHLHGCAPSR